VLAAEPEEGWEAEAMESAPPEDVDRP